MNSMTNTIASRRALLGMGAVGTAAAAWAFQKSRDAAEKAPTESAEAIVLTPGARYSDHLPDLSLTTQSGKSVRLVTDLIQNRIVLVSFMYTHCNGICPLTSALFSRLRKPLFREFGEDVRMVSISLDPETDTPAELTKYASAFGAENEEFPPTRLASWTFLTGLKEDIEAARAAFGYTDPDPAIDQDRTQHAGLFTFGNDRTNRWGTFPVGLPFDQTVAGIIRTVGTSTTHRYAWLPQPSADGV